jgi:hypothetical protein
VVVRQVVDSILAVGLSAALDCSKMDCTNFDGHIKISRLFPDAHDAHESTFTSGSLM